MKIYDFAVIGAGSAGCNTAYALHKKRQKVALIDEEGIEGGGSRAAGAFLSPLPGKKNPYNSFVNLSLEFALEFYENLAPEALIKKGVLRVPNKHFQNKKLETEEVQSRQTKFNDIKGYFFENAAIADPYLLRKRLRKGIDLYTEHIETLCYKEGFYLFKNFKAKNVILAQGVIKALVDIPYVDIIPVFGLKIDVKTTTKIPFNIHKSISISTNKKNGSVAIGATKQRHDAAEAVCETSCDKCVFYVNGEKQQVEELLQETKEIIELKDLKVAKVYRGARATIKSYFPVIGKVIDYKKSLDKYPSIKKGTKIPQASLEYYPNLYLINALGSRGFVFAPYLADLLTRNILEETPIPKEVSTQKLFYKAARRN